MTILSGIAAVAWDVDGTLVDSEATHHRALIAVSTRYGVAIAADDDRFVGVALDVVWEDLAALYPPTLERATWMRELEASFIESSRDLSALPGAIAAMSALAARGIRQCCVSNSPRTIVEANLTVIGAARFVEFAISRDDVTAGKPDPAPYRAACARLGLAPSRVLAVEDSAVGAASARAAGCPVLRVEADGAAFADLLCGTLSSSRSRRSVPPSRRAGTR